MSAKELQFNAPKEGLSINKGLHPGGWQLYKAKVQTGAIKAQLSTNDSKKTLFVPVAVFEFYFVKPGLREILLTLLPMILLFYLSLFSLVFDFSNAFIDTRFAVSVMGISGLLIQRIVIAEMSPKVGRSTTIDYMYISFLSLIFSIFIVLMFDVKNTDLEIVNDITFYVFQFLMLLFIWLIIRMQEREIDKIKGQFKFPFPKVIFRRSKTLSLSEYKKYSAHFEEFPQQFSASPLSPDYFVYFTERIKRYFHSPFVEFFKFFGLNIDGFSHLHFKEMLEQVIHSRESQNVNYPHILFHPLKDSNKFYIWGDLQGAFHSLTRSLSYLNEKGIINNNLEIMHPHHYFIFDGNVIGPSAYNLETLSLILTLMKQNPHKVFYLKGPHEMSDFWVNFGLQQELETIGQHLSSEKVQLDSSLSHFFNTLPLGLYLGEIYKGTLQCVTISSRSPIIINPSIISQILDDRQSIEFEPIQVNGDQPKHIPFHILARLRGLDDEKNYKQPMGLDLLVPEEGAIQWSMFSSPVEVHKEYYNFKMDSFVVLETSSPLSKSVLKSITRNSDLESEFHEDNFELLSGRRIDNSLDQKESFIKANEVKIGSTLDLSETASILGERLQRGLDLYARKVNREGGLNHGYVRIFFANDKYTPSFALQNVQKFISENKIWLILSPLGTSTTKALLSLSEEKSILILFPYTGSNIFRNAKLQQILHYRTSYANEACALAHYAKDTLFKQRFAFFYQDDDYGYAPMQAVKELLCEGYGVSKDAICEVPYQRNTILVDDSVTAIERHNPDVIFLFSTYAPSRMLIEKLGAQRLSDVTLMGISFLTDRFRDFASGIGDPEQQGKGLNFIISRVVPNPDDSSVEIVKEYQAEMQKEYPDIRYDVDSLEGYINTSILLDVLERIDRPYTPQKIIQEIEKMKKRDFKGLKLNFDPKTRSLSKNVWLDLGNGDWILSEKS